MFCLTEESLANHVGERKLREDLDELADAKKKELEEEMGEEMEGEVDDDGNFTY